VLQLGQIVDKSGERPTRSTAEGGAEVIDRSQLGRRGGSAATSGGRLTAFGAIVATAANRDGGNVPRGNRSMAEP